MHVQQAGEAARMRHTGTSLALESGIGAERAQCARSPRPRRSATDAARWAAFRAIIIDPKTGVLMGGSDLRKDGLAIGW